MISCRRATELISQRLDAEVSYGQRMTLGFHLLVCHKCQVFREQIIQINDKAHEFLRSDVVLDAGTTLPADARVRIQERLKTDTMT